MLGMRWYSGVAIFFAAIFLASTSGLAQVRKVTRPVEVEEDSMRFRVGAAVGFADYNFSYDSAGVDSDHDSNGVSWFVFVHLEAMDNLLLGVDWESAQLRKKSERFTIQGSPITDSADDAEADIDMVDIEATYLFARVPSVELGVVLGWHFYRQDFTRSNFTFDPTTSGIAFQPASEEHRGNGPKVGIRFDANPSPSWSLRVGADWARIFDAEVKNRALGTADTEGNSIRWRVNLGYHISKNVDLGVSYRGMVLDVDQDRSAAQIIPNSKTEMQGLLFKATFRFGPPAVPVSRLSGFSRGLSSRVLLSIRSSPCAVPPQPI